MRIAFIRFLIFLATTLVAYAILTYLHTVTDKGVIDTLVPWWNHPLIWMVSAGIGIFEALSTDPKDIDKTKNKE